ncbi:glutamine-binding protein [Intrasporangium oryzae NRRL B-24470]|uniref:Glutamine-binding protein n=1 Tax=Intrasporangium oryzae NRRL B-24470 TaxID=1386089 RepID=W9G1V6_9MICO|nr:ABC transporter substrate-binding protein [Intrasporangium oryzae]EWT00056.1 glutamine-binding protein [Intrasporangium oryzae NRRL B-24470]
MTAAAGPAGRTEPAEPLRLACIDSDAPPLFGLRDPATGRREGFEPAVAELVAAELGRRLEWVVVPWADLLPVVQAGGADAVLCGQGMTPLRAAQVDFTRPYAVFHESVLVRRGDPIASPEDLRGRRVAAIAASTNMALAETFDGAEPVAFGGDSDDVYADMLAALAAEEVDAVVDDDVVFVPLGDSDPRFEVAFTVRTGNRWGIGVSKERTDLREAIDRALGRVIADGRHRAAWEQWLPTLDYPFTEAVHEGPESAEAGVCAEGGAGAGAAAGAAGIEAR